MQISTATEVGVLTATASGLTYFVTAVGASLSPDVAAGISAFVAAITAYLSAMSLQAATASTPAVKT